MKSFGTKLAIAFGYVLTLMLMSGVPSASAQGVVTAEAVPSKANPSGGETITVDINIDVSGTNPARKLGSFTGTLQWNLEAIKYVSHSGVKTPFTGVVNDQNTGSGKLSFNGAYPSGATGKSNVLTVTFIVYGPNTVDLNFTAMLSALDFTHRVPILTVNDAALVTGIEEQGSETALPEEFALGQNYPNPFNPETEIKYDLPKESQVMLAVFNLVGQKVRTLVNNRTAPGRYSVTRTGTDQSGKTLASGVYIYRLQAGDFVQAHRMLLVK
jgi:hypothetical protein